MFADRIFHPPPMESKACDLWSLWKRQFRRRLVGALRPACSRVPQGILIPCRDVPQGGGSYYDREFASRFKVVTLCTPQDCLSGSCPPPFVPVRLAGANCPKKGGQEGGVSYGNGWQGEGQRRNTALGQRALVHQEGEYMYLFTHDADPQYLLTYFTSVSPHPPLSYIPCHVLHIR